MVQLVNPIGLGPLLYLILCSLILASAVEWETMMVQKALRRALQMACWAEDTHPGSAVTPWMSNWCFCDSSPVFSPGTRCWGHSRMGLLLPADCTHLVVQGPWDRRLPRLGAALTSASIATSAEGPSYHQEHVLGNRGHHFLPSRSVCLSMAFISTCSV